MNGSRNLRYHPAGSHIVHDRFDDEVVIINLKSGCYFGLRKTAAEIWGYVDKGADEVEILAALEAAYSAPAGEIEKAITVFLDELKAEDLVRAEEIDRMDRAAPAGTKTRPPNNPPPFSTPRLAKYEDQKELLLLDPIHEVGDLGWPEKK